MSGPLIPYLEKNEWPLSFLSFLTSENDPPTIKTFGILVALGVYIGSVVAVRHSKQRGLDQDKMNSFIFYVVGIGFIGGHVFDAIFYTPDRLIGPNGSLLYLVKIWAGLSSFGGFLGAIIGAVVFKYVKKEKILPYVDTVCSAFPLAWVFGRSGCASVHDHPGRCSDAWYAMKYPQHVPGLDACGEGVGRLDLGFIEMALTVPLAIAFWWLWRSKPRQFGFFAGWMCVAYAPVRFLLDFLRIEASKGHEADPRYLGLTPAQWACFGLVALGIAIIRLGKSYPPVPATYAELQEIARREMLEREGGDDDDGDDGEEDRKPAPKVVKTTTKVKAKAKPVVEEDASDDARSVDDSVLDEEAREEGAREEEAARPPTDAEDPPPDDAANVSEPAAEAPRPKKKKKKKAGVRPGEEARKPEPTSDD